MKSYHQLATGKHREKEDVQNHPAKYWGTMGREKVHRSDGSVSVDKTHGVNSRPHKKEELRNANRSMKKSARQKLKQDMMDEVEIVLREL